MPSINIELAISCGLLQGHLIEGRIKKAAGRSNNNRPPFIDITQLAAACFTYGFNLKGEWV